VTLDLVQRAEKAGYTALVVTADNPLKGRRELDFRNNFFVPAHLTMANFPDLKVPTGVGVNADFDPNISWKDIEWLR
jgi:isopentenyl diphosphate isomerase/L-lactate dehydrogenase-like FMN-dependent dehydrogenase